MKFESAAVYAGEEILSQPGNQNCQRAKTAREEGNQENTPVMETKLKQAAIAKAKSFEGLLKSLLKSYQRIAAGGRNICSLFISAQKVLRHSRDNRAGKEVGGQHGENHCLGERHK